MRSEANLAIRSTLRRPTLRRRGPAGRLADALLELANGHGCISSHEERSWASITFAGTRHKVVMEFGGPAAVEAGECFIVFLSEHEFAIPGQLVADAAVTEVSQILDPPCLSVTCELLLLEES